MMEKTELTLYLGGTRSGKSARAEAQALRTGGPVLYVATAEARPDDPSMHERIRRHRDRRPPHWSTLECPLHLAKRISVMFPAFFLEAAASVSPEQPPESGVGSSPKDAGEAAQERPTILIDCVTLWVSNILFALPEPEDLTAFETAVRTEVNALIALMERSNCRWILVSGETGLGGIASDRISRNYCDGLGLANQLIAASARKVFLVVAGCSLVLAEEKMASAHIATVRRPRERALSPHLPSTSGPLPSKETGYVIPRALQSTGTRHPPCRKFRRGNLPERLTL